MPVVTVPLLSEYKTEFVLGRLAETFFGGPKTFPGSTWPMNLVQVVLHQFPLVLTVIGVACYETGTVPLHVCCLAVGSSAAAIVLAVQCLVRHMKLLREPNSKVKSLTYACKDSQASDVDLQNICCNSDCTESIIPAKKFRVNIFIHSLVSALLCGYAVAYLTPSHLQRMSGSYAVAYVISVLGTFSVCVAQYSLTARTPPEPATFRPLDHLELRPLMRPFYIGVCYVLDIVSRTVDDQGPCENANKVLHVIFVMLPLFWLLNILPPLDALVPWFAEQVHVFLGGGSAACGDLRLFFQVGIWVACMTIVHFIPGTQWAVAMAAVFGFLLSLDLVGFFVQTIGPCRRLRSRVSATTVKTYSSMTFSSAFNWSMRHLLFFAVMLAVATALVAIIQSIQTSKKVRQTATHILGISLVAMYSITATVSSLNRVHLVFNLVKNPFYRVDATTGVKSVSTLQTALSKLRVALVSIVSPLLMVCYVTVSLAAFDVNVESRTRLGFFWAVAVLRAFRWIWQQTEVALMEVAVMYLMHTYFIPEDSISLVNSLLLASFVHDRVIEFTSKLTVALVISSASICHLKQRRPYSFFLLATNVLLFPVLVAIFAGSSLISAPLLPLFTLPVFAIGFPRPLRFWPAGADTPSSSSPDAVYYEISVSQLVTGFTRCCVNGSAYGARPGDYFLARFEDRLVFICVMEAGYGYRILRVEGLELQHTSCHAIEAARLDQIIDDAFGCPPSSEGGHRWNRRPFHTFQPFDTISINTHIDGRSILTGVLDRTLTLKLLAKCIPQCLLWVLANHCALEGRAVSEDKPKSGKADGVTAKGPDGLLEEYKGAAFGSPQHTTGVYSKLPRPPTGEQSGDLVEETVVFREERQSSAVRMKCQDGPTEAWADDEDPLGTNHDTASSAPVFRNRRISEDTGQTTTRAKTSGWTEATRNNVLPGAIVDLVDLESWSSLGLPASDVGPVTPIRRIQSCHPERKVNDSRYAKVFGPCTDWMDCSAVNDDCEVFTDGWFKTVVRKVREVTYAEDRWDGQVPEDDGALMEMYRQVVSNCQRSVKPKDTVLTPSLAAHVFGGDLPWSQHSEWLLCRPLLKQLVIKAFRYACKLALDQALLGEVESNEELLEYLESYDKHWYIGPDTDPLWTEALRKQIPGLFSFSFNPISGSFVSHVATFQKQAVALGKLNREAVRAVWATLNLELLYLTNDDEERYSIQAHSSLLRNLAVQAAWPPLGYPIYVSSPIVCPTVTWT